MAAEYGVDGAVSKLGGRSEAMKALDVAMHYNYNLWMVHYLFHLEQLETVTNIGDITKMSKMEVEQLIPYSKTFNASNVEIGNLSPQDLFENPVTVRIATQFSWGSRYCPPFVHSNHSLSCVVATLQKLGK